MALNGLEKEILKILEKKGAKLTFSQFIVLFGEKNILPLKEALEKLEVEGKIYLNDSQEYILFPKEENLVIGEVRYDCKHRPFVLSGHNMVFIPDDQLNGALKGDIVLVKRNQYTKIGESKSIVEKILKRQNNTIVFECRKKNGKKLFVPYNIPFHFRVSLSKKDRNALQDGDRFFLEIDKINHNGNFHGDVICFVGHKGDPNLDIKTIAASHGIRIEFPEEVLEEAEEIPDVVTQQEIDSEIEKGRVDLRSKMIFTIDGKKSKDLDDAISLEINERGNFLLGVHIADVSYYVKEGSKLQQEALLRGHSYYFLDLVFPMLPPKLSNGICSLNPGVDRMTKTCEVEISPEGKILGYRCFNSIIRSKKKMAYEEVNQIFDHNDSIPSYQPFLHTLDLMYQLSYILDRKKYQRGYINFGDKDFIIHTNEAGIPTHITPLIRGSSEKLIENFMLLANEMIATYSKDLRLEEEQLPYIYRIHGIPDKERIKEALTYLMQSGYPLDKIDWKDPKEFQKLVESVSQLDAYPAISDILIRGLSKAKYSIDNLGHFGLALDHYTHFTSPIRRYSDLQTHYNINNYVSQERRLLDPKIEREKMLAICKHTTRVEKIAESTDQEITGYKLAQFMDDKVGQTFQSMITHVSKNHVVVRTEDFVTGTLLTSDLINMGFELINNGTTLVHPTTKEHLRIGDILTVQLEEANTETRKIRFTIPKENSKVYVKKGA